MRGLVPWLLPSLLAPLGVWARPRHEYVSPAFLRQYDPARVGRAALTGEGALPDALPRGDEVLPAP
ncbi:MAG: hypothetical protein KC613_28265, partial [Myxococcales bacterium]|nr:hypothetical protein [Myxococcales bacterium]